MKDENQIIRVGGIGTGRIFQWAHIRVYPKLLDKVMRVGFYDKNPIRAGEARDKYISVLEEHALKNPEVAEIVKINMEELQCHDTPSPGSNCYHR
jgi:predicted dehydrogenase